MALKEKNCLSTKTVAVIIGPVNMVISNINLVFCMLHLSIFIAMDIQQFGTPEAHIGFSDNIPSIILLIGILTNVLHFAFSIILKIGVQKRKSKLVLSYLIVGSVSAFLSLLLLAAGALTLVTLCWCMIVLLVQVYFVIILSNEYKIIRGGEAL